jgi:hypothetical protein
VRGAPNRQVASPDACAQQIGTAKGVVPQLAFVSGNYLLLEHLMAERLYFPKSVPSSPIKGDVIHLVHRAKVPLIGSSKSERFLQHQRINLPPQLTTADNFILYKLGPANESGRRSKTPVHHQTGHKLKGWDKPENWLSFDEARRALEGRPESFGIGYVMTGSDIVCIDIDQARNPDGTYTMTALSLVEQIPGWVEISASGNLHIWTRAKWHARKTVHDEISVEVFYGSGFVALTGDEYEAGRSIPEEPFDLSSALAVHRAPVQTNKLDLFEQYCLRDRGWDIDIARKFVMEDYPPTPGRAAWIEVGQILHFQFKGSEEAFELWNDFSQRDGCGDYRGEADLRYHWQSFRLDHPNPKTLATLMAKAPKSKGAPKVNELLRRVLLGQGQDQADRYVLNQLIPEGITLIAGSPGTGKTTLIVDLVACVAHLCEVGHPLRVKGRRKVVYLTEDSGQIRRLFDGKIRFGGLQASAEEVNQWVYVLETQRLNASQLAGLIVDLSEEHTVSQQFGSREVVLPPLFVFDTSSATFDIEDENKNSEVSAFIAALKLGIGQTGASVWIISHTPKNAPNSRPEDLTARGAGAWGGDVQATCYITREKGKPLTLHIGKIRVETKYKLVEFEAKFHECFIEDMYGDTQTVTHITGAMRVLDREGVMGRLKLGLETDQRLKDKEVELKILLAVRDGEKLNSDDLRRVVKGNHDHRERVLGGLQKEGKVQRREVESEEFKTLRKRYYFVLGPNANLRELEFAAI